MTDEQVQAKTMSLLDDWRNLLLALQGYGWPSKDLADPRSSFYANCLPMFVAYKPQTRCCRLDRFCPWCYARRVVRIYERVEAAWPDHLRRATRARKNQTPPSWLGGQAVRRLSFPGAPTQPQNPDPHPLVTAERVASFRRGQLHTIPQVLDQLPRLVQANIRAVKHLGAVLSITVEPTSTGANLRVARLFMLSPGQDCSEQLRDPWTQVAVNIAPTRSAIQRAVSTTCRYPRELFHCDTGDLADILGYTAGYRLCQTYGAFRNKSEKGA